MSRYIRWSLIFILGVFIIIAGTAPNWLEILQPLLQEEQVAEEGFPCPPSLSMEICESLDALSQENPAEAEAMVTVLLSDPAPAPSNEQDVSSLEADFDRDTVSVFTNTLIRTGDFMRLDLLHWATGSANVYEIVADETDRQYLRLEDGFEVAQGPDDMSLYLSIIPEPRSGEEMLAGDSAVRIGLLKGNVGAQNYELPEDVDITQFASVVVYSEQFNRIVSIATLEQPVQ